MFRIDSSVSDPGQDLRADQHQSGRDDQKGQHVHLGKASAPGGERHPYSAGRNHTFDTYVAEPSPAALARIGPHDDRGAEGEDKDQARTGADHRRALAQLLFGATLRFALHFLNCRRWLGRKSVELPLDFL